MQEKNKQITPESFLHRAMPNMANSPVVTRSAQALERRTGKIAGNAEAKIGAFAIRLEAIAQDQGSREKLTGIFSDRLLVDEKDIPESYWISLKQRERDDGYDTTLSDDLKTSVTEELRDAQRTGIESWTSYLTGSGAHYPTWFRLYALDGMSKLGVFNMKEGEYEKRTKGTVAPYPQLNPEALEMVYDLVAHHRLEGAQKDSDTRSPNSNNFNKLYSHFLLETSAIIPTPEKAEDVRGHWRRYDTAEELVQAAQGTPWCIAGMSYAKYYLDKPDSEFHIFHLENPDTGEASPSGAASVRMENGRVAEISGLASGSEQNLEDALVPEVMEKVLSLPGGEAYIEAYEDKQRLVAMDRKFQKQPKEPFTIEELEFLYELHREITYLDPSVIDRRPVEFKEDKATHIEQLAAKYGRPAAEAIVMDRQAVEIKG